jgi:DNA-binding HxlR family transcriptional regulator
VPEEDKDQRITELTDKIERLEGALRDIAVPYGELVGQINRFQEITQKYFRLLDLYQRHGVISVDTILPEVKDPYSKEIVRIVMDRENLNISQITEELRKRTGSASRRIVRERLEDLVEKRVLEEETGKRSKTYRVTDDVVRRWSQVLGLSK